jgi:hypothetical protein
MEVNMERSKGGRDFSRVGKKEGFSHINKLWVISVFFISNPCVHVCLRVCVLLLFPPFTSPLAVLGFELRALFLLGKHSIFES